MKDVREWTKASVYQISLLLERLDPDEFQENYTRKDNIPFSAGEKPRVKNAPLLRDYLLKNGFVETHAYSD